MALSSVKDVLKMINYGQQTEYSLYYHALVAFAPRTNCPISGGSTLQAKAVVRQYLQIRKAVFRYIAKILVVDIGTIPAPIDNSTAKVDQPTHFNSDYPAPIGFTFSPDLSLAAALANRVDKFNAVTVNHVKRAGFRQKLFSQPRISCQKAQQAGSIGQVWEQAAPITRKPAVKSSEMPALERKQHSDGDDFTGMQFRLWVAIDRAKFIVYVTKEPNNNRFGSHWFVFLLASFVIIAKSVEQTNYFFKSKAGYYSASN
jgi:hypothetical protein